MPPAAKRSLLIIGSLLAAMWGVELVDWIGGRWLELDQFGIVPRRVSGLPGIPLAPLLHAGWSHLAANSLPFAILGLFVMGRGERTFWTVSAGIVVLGGLAVWLLGRGQAVHVGASGLIFGYFGYLVALGVIERSVASILRALAVGLFYGSIIWGVLPNHRGVSWESHLFGLLTGIAMACLSSRAASVRRRGESAGGVVPPEESGIR
jgi:membrane associated rhomboid family serine protease